MNLRGNISINDFKSGTIIDLSSYLDSLIYPSLNPSWYYLFGFKDNISQQIYTNDNILNYQVLYNISLETIWKNYSYNFKISNTNILNTLKFCI
jgi:hypothetical protein